MHSRAAFRHACVVMAVMCSVTQPSVASAQYFGANKVQYKALQFRVLQTEHFDIYFHQDGRETVDIAARLAERWWERLSDFFGRQPWDRQPLVLYASHVTFEQTLVVPGLIDASTGGVTEWSRRRIAMPFAASLAETDHVLGHELVHAFQFDIMGGSFGEDLPLWFVEGLAEFVTLGRINAHTAMWLRDAVAEDNLPSISELEQPRYFPYRWGHAFWAYVSDRWGRRAAADLFSYGTLAGVNESLERILDVSPEQFAAEWHQALRTAYQSPPGIQRASHAIVPARAPGGSMNLGPALSPDGRWVAFLSDRSLVSMDLFVADAVSGTIAARLTDTAGDPRYSNLQYVDSAGAWDREGRRLAVGTVTGGRAAISVFGWPGGRRETEIRIEDVDEIYSPTWSPDGRSIAFSGMVDGVTDLFVYEFEPVRLRRLTRDPFSDMQPSWEPDGRRIAFVTDRFTTDLGTLSFGTSRLALIDADTGAVEPVSTFGAGKHVSPDWSPDGRWIHFVSDHDGTSDVYSVDLEGGELQRLTRMPTGVSGLSASSPAISVAAQDGALAFTVFRQGRIAIHRVESPCGEPVDAAPSPGLHVPPVDTGTAAYPWRDVPVTQPAAPAPVVKYRPRLSLDRVSDAAFGVGASRLGATIGGGVGVAFSDILNTHWLTGALQLAQTTTVSDAAVYGAYLNQARRWNWGVIGSSMPSYVSVQSLADPARPLVFGPIELVRMTERVGVAFTSYAFDRARRIEFQGSVSRLAFDRFLVSGDGDEDRTTAAPALTLGTGGVALVRDTTTRGPLSVVRGERYRLEAAPTFGTLQYVNVLADYRRYVMPVPFYTIATRALHFGRYGHGANDIRLPRLYLGYPNLVRGYDLDSVIAQRCVAPLASRCDQVNSLVGSRLAVANVELRFPLLRPLGLSSRMYGPGMELAFFSDG